MMACGLVGDWSVVGSIGSDDSRDVHQVVAGLVELTHLSQAGGQGRRGEEATRGGKEEEAG